MTAEPDFVERLHDAWDRFVAEVSDVIRKASPVVDEAKAAAEDLEAAAAHDLDRTEPQSNIAAPRVDMLMPLAPPTEVVPASSEEAAPPVASGTESPTAPAVVEEPKSNIDPAEDQTGDTVAATLPPVATEVETHGPGETPADSVSLGTTSGTMPVSADPAADAAAAQAEANAHPTVTGEAGPMPDDVAQWLVANGLKTEPA